MKAATYALDRNCSVVICNGCEENAIINIVKGKKVGTFFTKAQTRGTPVEVQAKQGENMGQTFKKGLIYLLFFVSNFQFLK